MKKFLIFWQFSSHYLFSKLWVTWPYYYLFCLNIVPEEIWFHFTSDSIKPATVDVPVWRQRYQHPQKKVHFRGHSRLQIYQNWNQRHGKWHYLESHSNPTDHSETDQQREITRLFFVVVECHCINGVLVLIIFLLKYGKLIREFPEVLFFSFNI